MKTKIKFKLSAMFIALLMTSFFAFGQGTNLKLDGNNNFNATSKVGPTNNADFKIITRDSTRMTITKAGDVIINKSLTVDSLKVKNMMVVGDPLTISWACPICPVVRPFTASYFGASENALVLQGGNPTDLAPIRDNIRYGIGHFPLATGPIERVHLNDSRTSFFGLISNNVFQKFTNAFTGSAAGDGFNIGVTGGLAVNAQHALLNNQEQSRHILLQLTPPTSAAAGGNVGIDGAFSAVNYPKRKLDVIDDGTFSAGGRPQLRLTQTANINPLLGNFTDFQTTALGDLAINPRSAGVERRVGININTPANTLEINSPSLVFLSTASGLKFTDVNNFVIPPVNPTTGVLSLDGTGNVIWVQGAGGGTGDVIACTSSGITTNFLPKWSPASNKELCNSQFIDDGIYTGINTVGAGTLFNVPASATSGVYTNAGNFNIGGSGTAFYTGVQGTSAVSSANQNIGVRGDASGATQNYGVQGFASGNANFNFGGYFQASGTAGNYGIYATVVPNTIGLAGYFDGDVVRTGTDNFTSDAIFKENINTISSGWQVISQLIPREFNFKTDQYPFMGLHGGLQYGFVAQEVENIVPELVGSAVHPERLDSTGAQISPTVTYKTLNYLGIIPFLVKTVQEQQAQIDSLKNANARIIIPSGNTNTQEIKLALPDGATLGDAQPNPNSGSTQIPYYLPQNTIGARIIFTDMLGKVMEEKLLQSGYGLLNINTEDLPAGIYSYSLAVDGKVIDNKKMIRNK